MYTDYFGFDSKPFKPKDPYGFYRNADFDAACAAILRGIRTRQGFILLTGEAGLGKTLTLRRCMVEADDIRFILLGNAHLDFPDILNYLCADLGLRDDESDAGRQNQLLEVLAAYASRGQAVALLVDDAHHLRVSTLQQLWDFVEMSAGAGAGQGLRVVLTGLPEIEDKLRQPELRPLQASVQVRYRLERLSTVETSLFIAHQLKAAGHASGDLLSPAVIERVAHYGQGTPRAIALVCDTVLLFASLQSEREITPAMVDEAARSCFLGEPSDAAAPGAGNAFDLSRSELDFSFDLTLNAPLAATSQPAAGAVPVEAGMASANSQPPDAVATTKIHPSTTTSLGAVQPTLPIAPSLREFLQLLGEIAAKQDRKEVRDQESFHRFHHRYQWLSHSGPPAWLAGYEQRMARLAETKQPILVALATTRRASPEPAGVLCALLINPTWWLYREIRVRLRSADLTFANDGQAVSPRLLDGRDAQSVYLEYRLARTEPGPATLHLEIDLLDHRGVWSAYHGLDEIRLMLPHPNEAGWRMDEPVEPGHDQFWPDFPAMPATAPELAGAGSLAFTLPLELAADHERTHRLRVSVAATGQGLGRGTALTRALLLAADPSQAPARIELVSRPFMILGRYNPATGVSFGDFALGFVPEYMRISRLHAVICALGDQLALMPASNRGRTCTGRNGQRLDCGQWHLLETGDSLEICDLYRLKLTLVWDHNAKHGQAPGWDVQEPRDKFGRYLLDLAETLRQRDQHASSEEVRAELRNRYVKLTSMQDRVTELNDIGNPGVLLHARFERDDVASRQVIHYYIPKWLSLGSSPQAGLRIAAAGVAPLHAELLFRKGMYWIQNLAGPGSIQVGCHGLATNEVLALEAGDALTIGTARFGFEAY